MAAKSFSFATYRFLFFNIRELVFISTPHMKCITWTHHHILPEDFIQGPHHQVKLFNNSKSCETSRYISHILLCWIHFKTDMHINRDTVDSYNKFRCNQIILMTFNLIIRYGKLWVHIIIFMSKY